MFLSRRYFVHLLEALLISEAFYVPCKVFGAQASPSSSSNGEAEQRADLKNVLDSISAFALEVQRVAGELKDELHHLINMGLIVSIGLEYDTIEGRRSASWTSGFVASINPSQFEIGGGQFQTIAPLVAAEVPGPALAVVLTAGLGDLNTGFYGASTTVSAASRRLGLSISENSDYVGLGIAEPIGKGSPALSFSHESFTVGPHSTFRASEAAAQAISEFMDYLWSASQDRFHPTARPW